MKSYISTRSSIWIFTGKVILLSAALLPGWFPLSAAPPPIEEIKEEPVIYTGSETADKRWHHGGFKAAVGVHKIQTYRATRNQPLEGDNVGWTYNHAPMLAHWQGRFWMNYVSNRVEEHGTPGKTGFASSIDGYHWEFPTVGFPVVTLPEIKPQARYFGGRDMAIIPEGSESVMHQRMGFYVAPNGRLLTSGFYSYCPNVRYGPNRGQGLGRVIREVYPDGELGSIYFIRYNRHAGWNETNTPFPFYKTSKDSGLVKACEDLLADKRMTLQWWEDDRGDDGFFTLEIPQDLKINDLTFGPIPEDDVNYIEPKALSFYERPDGVTVGLFKSGLAALSPDDGLIWIRGRHHFPESAAKIWGQKTEDGRYALVYDHSATRRNRFPLVAVSGDDGYAFDNILTIHAEVPPMRFRGVNKALGILICADRRWPESSRVLRVKGARLILNPTYGFWNDLNEAMIRTRSYENEIYFAFTHPRQGLVTGTKGEVVSKEQGPDDGSWDLLITDLDLGDVDDHGHMADRRPEIYQELTETK